MHRFELVLKAGAAFCGARCFVIARLRCVNLMHVTRVRRERCAPVWNSGFDTVNDAFVLSLPAVTFGSRQIETFVIACASTTSDLGIISTITT